MFRFTKSRYAALPILATVATIALTLGLSSNAMALTHIDLTTAGQGAGNKGTSFTPVDSLLNPAPVVITAKAGLNAAQKTNPFATGQVGTVVISDGGAGAEDINGVGSLNISVQEQLRFAFAPSVKLGGVKFGFTGLNLAGGLNANDDPIIFISTATNPNYGITVSELQLLAGYTSTGVEAGTLALGDLLALNGNALLSDVIVRSNRGGFKVEFLEFQPIPEPITATLGLIGLTAATLAGTRRRMGQSA